ncbi:hypothetical protein bthur0013_57470 [Bacillus thuringiensis IBL 200]|nr:hypothetical protein bthur0013_57470 [Bacillus thuringiensis IBL 200]
MLECQKILEILERPGGIGLTIIVLDSPLNNRVCSVLTIFEDSSS